MAARKVLFNLAISPSYLRILPRHLVRPFHWLSTEREQEAVEGDLLSSELPKYLVSGVPLSLYLKKH